MEFNNKKLFIGLYEKALPKSLDWEERLMYIRDAGYSFMELSIDETDERIERLKWDSAKKENLKKISKKVGIPIMTLCLSANRRFPIGSAYPDIQKKGMEIITDAIQFAFQMGIRIIQIAGYDVIAGERSTGLSKRTFCLNLRKCLSLAAMLGVMLAIENVDTKFTCSLKGIMCCIKDVNSPWLKVYPDVGNLNAMSQNVLKELIYAKNSIVAVHLKDTVEGVVRKIPYGDGEVDFISVFKGLKRINFYGPLLLEMWSDNNTDNYKIIINARKWIENKIKESGYY